MTFDPNVPNGGQSPGQFPAQNNTNFTRLKTIINADHIFNDTGQTTDGFHRQCTLISRAQPSSLPTGSNSILYSWLDGSNQNQLRFYNGVNDYQVTPFAAAPVKVTGSVVLAGGATSASVYTIPTNTYGTIFVNYISPPGGLYRLLFFYNSGGSFTGGDVIAQTPDQTGRPNVSFTSNQIKIINGQNSNRTVAYYIIAESI